MLFTPSLGEAEKLCFLSVSPAVTVLCWGGDLIAALKDPVTHKRPRGADQRALGRGAGLDFTSPRSWRRIGIFQTLRWKPPPLSAVVDYLSQSNKNPTNFYITVVYVNTLRPLRRFQNPAKVAVPCLFTRLFLFLLANHW